MSESQSGEAAAPSCAERGSDHGAAEAALAVLLDRLHDAQPLRVWSLIITFFGDAIAPRGGEVWAGTVSELLGAMGVDAAAVRAALSRLARDGWLERTRVGRLSYYALSGAGREAFGPAIARVYATPRQSSASRLRIVCLPDGDPRGGLRDAALKSGYGQLAPGVLLGTDVSPPLAGEGAARCTVLAADILSGPRRELVERAFDLAPLARRYHQFIEGFTPLAEALESAPPVVGEQAMVARLLLIHAYRRLILRDPALSPELLPGDWPGLAANALCARLYRLLLPASDEWLSQRALCRDGALPAPDASYFDRFPD
ncbi:GntR family transcriptional regulator [Stappia taiwanensis]|uniref:GntR family transcriptional regulator n=1 Tax=Stappia taiwanensis TaxID=992267 RepID=A0A838XMF9_9HYPH|nr:PaaX family transcriptional regulator C-terminal domain-containing protein [Stappia taiwanensis]MBA4611695.1 GntR family transcriptional regulator [Stappia taiwanensis]GGE97500.1 phenylacetic acid degradation operon negative regulatory protein [Stappia taiwanensis]